MKNNEKLAGYLNLALRAGTLILGVDKIRETKHKLYAVLADTVLAEGSMERLKRKAEETKTPLYIIEGLSELLHKENCRAAGIADVNIRNAIKPYLEKE